MPNDDGGRKVWFGMKRNDRGKFDIKIDVRFLLVVIIILVVLWVAC